MNFYDFVNMNGICKTAAGYKIKDLRTTGFDNAYPLIGFVDWGNGHLSEFQWTKDGLPKNLPLNHGMHLVALKPRVEYDIVDIKGLKELPKEYACFS